MPLFNMSVVVNFFILRVSLQPTRNPDNARKLKAVPVFSITDVIEPLRGEFVRSGMEVSMLATTTRPTIIVTAAITTVRIRLTMSI
jgi:hypothetical protein